MFPQARQAAILTEPILDEIVVYDQTRHRAHGLNRTTALVWQHCDGRTSVAELAQLLQRQLGLPPDEGLVWLALDQLDRAHLLQDGLKRPAETARVSRREVLHRLGRTAGVALLLPVVASVVAPAPASAHGLGQPCENAPAKMLTGGDTGCIKGGAAKSMAEAERLLQAACKAYCKGGKCLPHQNLHCFALPVTQLTANPTKDDCKFSSAFKVVGATARCECICAHPNG